MYAPLYFEIPTPMGDLGFASGSYVGRTRLGYASGSPAHGLGSISNNEWGIAVSAGISASDLNTLDMMGATDLQIDALIAGDTDFITLMSHLSGTQPVQPITAANMQYEPTDWASYGVESALQDLDSDISLMESWEASTPAVANAVGNQIHAERVKYNAWAAQYQGWVNQTSTPDVIHMQDGSTYIGQVSQAGMNPMIIVGAAVLLGVAAAIVTYHHDTVAGTKGQAAAAKAQAEAATAAINNANSMNQSADQDTAHANAIRNTNPTLAKQYDDSAAAKRAQANEMLHVAQSPGGAGGSSNAPIDWGSWFQKNATWLAIAGVAVFVGPSLVKKL